jgi:hypothetical protein
MRHLGTSHEFLAHTIHCSMQFILGNLYNLFYPHSLSRFLTSTRMASRVLWGGAGCIDRRTSELRGNCSL